MTRTATATFDLLEMTSLFASSSSVKILLRFLFDDEKLKNVNIRKMPNLKQVRDHILIAHAEQLISDEEFCILYDINTSKNPSFPYDVYDRFDLDFLTDEECISNFRFLKNDIYRLVEVFGYPEKFTCYNGTVYNSVEAICIFLRRFAYPCRYSDMIHMFGRPVPQLCMISNHLLNFMYEHWNHLLSTFQQNWLTVQNLQKFCDDIHQRGAPLSNCFGFVDGTVRPICRPSTNQRIVYNGHKRIHSLKFQSVVTPNGLVANLFGPVEGKRHDSGMLALSGLLGKMTQHCVLQNGNPLCIYGDPAYPLHTHLQRKFQGANITPQQQQWNTDMNKVRTSVEWVFGDIVITLLQVS